MKIVVILCLALVALVSTVSAGCQCDDDFSGFGTEPGKCGCCPWPCCCKCLDVVDVCPDQCPCIEFAFLIDESGSIGSADWTRILEYTQTIINSVVAMTTPDTCGDQVFVAVITFGNNATLHYNLDPYQVVDITTIVQGKKHTNLVEAMEVAVNEVYVKPSECVKFALIITDGRANFRVDEIAGMGNALRTAVDNNLYCLGMTTNIDEAQLTEVCPEESHRISELYFDDIVDTATALIGAMGILLTATEECEKEVCFCCCAPEQFWGGYAGGRY